MGISGNLLHRKKQNNEYKRMMRTHRSFPGIIFMLLIFHIRQLVIH